MIDMNAPFFDTGKSYIKKYIYSTIFEFYGNWLFTLFVLSLIFYEIQRRSCVAMT